MVDEFFTTERIAYFTMEIALQSSIPTYSGGLGVLAGDMVRSAVDSANSQTPGTPPATQRYLRQRSPCPFKAGRSGSVRGDTW